MTPDQSGCAPEADAGPFHYPGTYAAGLYNRLYDEIAGVRIDNAGEPAEVEAEMLAWVKAQGFGG